jgi:hypothetical protein
MENRIQKLGQLLQRNNSWKWLGENTLLGDSSVSQYSGLKIFVRYILDKRTSLIDQREDKGVAFTSSGDNPICRDFIQYLQAKAEETGGEKEKAQLLWMANRAEAMLQMEDTSLGQMNDGILLAHAFTLISLGEKANPRIEVNEGSIVGLLEGGLALCKKESPELSPQIDLIAGKKGGQTLTPATGGTTTTPAATPAATPSARTPFSSGGGGGGGSTTTGGTSKSKSERFEVPGEKEEPKKEEPEEGKKERGVPVESEETPEGPTKGTSGSEVEEGEDELSFGTGGGPASGRVKRTTKRKSTTRTGKKEKQTGKIKIPGSSGFKSQVIPAGKGKRKKVSKKRKMQQAKDESGQRERQRVPQAPQPQQTASKKRQPAPPSGGWAIAKRAGKIAAGGTAGAGAIGWAASGTDAVASTFTFIHTLF